MTDQFKAGRSEPWAEDSVHWTEVPRRGRACLLICLCSFAKIQTQSLKGSDAMSLGWAQEHTFPQAQWVSLGQPTLCGRHLAKLRHKWLSERCGAAIRRVPKGRAGRQASVFLPDLTSAFRSEGGRFLLQCSLANLTHGRCTVSTDCAA